MAYQDNNRNIWALVPIKSLEGAKSRLAGVLTPEQRKTLAKAMLCDVLDTLALVEGLAGILVVTDDAEVMSITEGFGVTAISDPIEKGMNSAIRHGMRWLDAKHGAGVIVVPGDIPFVTPEELNSVLVALRSNSVVIVPAIRDGGTNVLGIASTLSMQPSFGQDSFARHVGASLALGSAPKIIELDGAGHDIDVAADLIVDIREGSGSRTRIFIGQFTGVGFSGQTESFKEGLRL
jgi:2-phospho-L-lactate guanylyltransferase